MTQKNSTLSKLIDDVKYIVNNSKPEEDISITLHSMKNHENIHNDIKEACLFFYCYDNNKEKFKHAYRIAIQKYSTTDGKKTIWAQQYDPVTLLPTSARSFEKKSLCSLESAQLLIYLMSLPEPDGKIKAAIYDGCNWFKQNAISNYKQVINDGEVSIINNLNNERNLYARYYDLESNGPVFFDREGITYNLESFNDVPIKIRNGYTWLGCWGDYLLEIYAFWKTIHLP